MKNQLIYSPQYKLTEYVLIDVVQPIIYSREIRTR